MTIKATQDLLYYAVWSYNYQFHFSSGRQLTFLLCLWRVGCSPLMPSHLLLHIVILCMCFLHICDIQKTVNSWRTHVLGELTPCLIWKRRQHIPSAWFPQATERWALQRQSKKTVALKRAVQFETWRSIYKSYLATSPCKKWSHCKRQKSVNIFQQWQMWLMYRTSGTTKSKSPWLQGPNVTNLRDS